MEFVSNSRIYLVAPLIFVLGIAGIILRIWIDAALPLLADAIPMLIAIVGVVMSYKQPKRENHLVTTVVLVVLGMLGTGIMFWTRIRSEASHKREVRELNDKISSVAVQNTHILDNQVSSQGTGARAFLPENRKQNILSLLRNEYILSHDSISPGLLAGTELPPSEWINKRLHELGETWTVAEPASPSARISAKQEPLDVRGENLCQAILEFAQSAKQEELLDAPGSAISATDTLNRQRVYARISAEFDRQFRGPLSVLASEFKAKGVEPEMTLEGSVPWAYEAQIRGQALCRMVSVLRAKQGIPEPLENIEHLKLACYGEISKNDPLPTVRNDELGPKAIDLADAIETKADVCMSALVAQQTVEGRTNARESFAQDIRHCCLSDLEAVHLAIGSRCPRAVDVDGERNYQMFVNAMKTRPSCTAQEVSKYLRQLGQAMNDMPYFRQR
jgi:hypothetical protein